MVEGIEYIVQSTYRKLDSYTTDKPQLIPLYALNQDGSVADKPCIDLDNRVPTIAENQNQSNVVVRDARTGKLYLQSTKQSRFLNFGCDTCAPQNVVGQDCTGQVEIDSVTHLVDLFSANPGISNASRAKSASQTNPTPCSQRCPCRETWKSRKTWTSRRHFSG